MKKDLIEINNKDLQVKEFQNRRVLTFKDIDFVHERAEGTAKRNFSENKKHFVENVDYFEVSTKNVPSLEEYGFSKFAPSGILITESGYLMLVKSLTDDLAWQVQRQLVDNYFRGKQLVSELNNLSPQLQLLISMELKQKEMELAITETKQEIQDMREVISLNPQSWRKETSTLINKIALNLGGYDQIKIVREEIYKLLDQRFGVDLKTRLTNKRRRLADEGVSKSKRDKLTIIDVIADDKKLIEGYIAIVKEMAIKYKVA